MITSADEFVALRESADPVAYRRAARDSAPEAVWLEVIARYPTLRFWVAQNKTVPLSVLRVLAADADAAVRGMVARKRSADAALLARLARDADSSVRHQVACNRSTPPALLQQLAHDAAPFVAAAAQLRRTPERG